MQNLVWISLFGVLGILSRYGIDQYFNAWNETFPITTFAINIIGSFVAGCLYSLTSYRDFSPNFNTILLVGFCGGFTTFSSYALQTVTLVERGKLAPALTYLILSPIVGLLAAYLPVLITKRILI